MVNRLDVNMQDGLKAVAEGVQGQNYLGDANVVGKLVRDFFAEVFNARARFHQNQEDQAAIEHINEQCRTYGRVFMGESEGYVAQPWNSPHRLGNYLRATVPDVGDYASTGEAYFQFLAVQALNASIALEEGHMSEDEVKAGMTEVVDDAVDVLLGRKVEGRA